MITNTELNISNKSYISKDFASIYPEVLELAKKLSNRWDPETSNESDPGLVLLKALGFIGDKLNYNIDKNVLECFMPSATQEESMRNLCSMNGYNMKRFSSATTDIAFMYTNTLEDGKSFTLPKYSTVITSSDDGSIKYTLIEDCTVYAKNQTAYATAMEGTLETLTVGDSTTVQLSNIDDNYRLYLPSISTAENGIFITNVGDTVNWEKVINLFTKDLGNKYYSVGFDSKKLSSYIEFPEDIAQLIGNGLTIRYMISSGSSGNVSANTLNKLVSPDSVYYDGDVEKTGTVISDLSDKLTINNLSAVSNGSDPETIDEAYNSFKKVVGTFETLVSCKDYENYIYNAVDEDTNNYVVSNVAVSDRRTDFNFGNNILTFDVSSGEHIISNTDNTIITPFNLCVYALSPMGSVNSVSNYNSSFKPLSYRLNETNPALADIKDISHDYKDLTGVSSFIFLNKYVLNAKISTYAKIDSIQQELLISNIRSALVKNFNARKVDFGEELPYDNILSVIEGADSRISSVILDEPTVITYVMNASGEERKLCSTEVSAAELIREKIIARNVLNGNVSLFDYDTDCTLEFGESSVPIETSETPGVSARQVNDTSINVYKNIVGVSTESIIPQLSLNSGYTVKENELIQFATPSLETSTQYGPYVNYRFESQLKTKIDADEVYQLQGTDVLKFYYIDSETSVAHTAKYTATSITLDGIITETPYVIVKPNFELKIMDESVTSISKRSVTFEGNDETFWTMGASETVDIKEYVKDTLTSASFPCYWIMGNTTNTLFDREDIVDYTDSQGATRGYIEVVLQNGEYLIYSNTELTDLVILGSGTKLKLMNLPSYGSRATFTNWTLNNTSAISLETIQDSGLAAFSAVDWQYKQLQSTPLEVSEMTIYTAIPGDVVSITKMAVETPNFGSLTNYLRDLSGYSIVITSNGTSTVLDNLNIPGVSWAGRSRLDLNITPTVSQKLYSNQYITLYKDGLAESYSISGDSANLVNINFNYNVIFAGSNKAKAAGQNTIINIAKRLISGIVVTIDGGLTSTVYRKTALHYPTSTDTKYSNKELLRNSDGFYAISLKGFGASVSTSEDAKPISLPVLGMKKKQLFMIYYDATVNQSGSPVTTVQVSSTTSLLKHFNSVTPAASTINLNAGINTIEIVPDTLCLDTTLTINHNGTTTSDVIYIKNLNLVSGLNPKLLNDFVNEGVILSTIQALDTNNKFYYLNSGTNKDLSISTLYGELDSEGRLIHTEDETVLSPSVFWDKNNVVNRFTIGQIDFTNSSISVMKSSQK